jgi:PKD repeat protein
MYSNINGVKVTMRWLLMLTIFFTSLTSALAQDVIYSENFTNGASYCSGSSQYDNWGLFRAALDTTTKKFRKVTVKGSLDPTGVTCNDPDITKKIADALRQNVYLSVSCNGVPWVVAPGCYGGCGTLVDAVELIVNYTGTCACAGSPAFILRPIIGNLNWGGIGGTTCSSPTQTMEVIFSNPVGNNPSPFALTAPLTSCGSASDSLSAIISNTGSNKVGNIPVRCVVTGTLGGSAFNNTYNATITDSLTSGQSKGVKFANINTSNGADLNIVVYTMYPTDTFHSDDTIKIKYKNVGTPTGNPTATDVSRCGSGPLSLSATLPSGHIGYWYNRLNQLVAVGNSVTSPPVPGGTSDSFYVAAAKTSPAQTISGGFTGGNTSGLGYESGNMFDLTVSKYITIDSLDVHIQGTAARKVTIYIKSGTYALNQTLPGNWTKVGTYDVTAAGAGAPTRIRFNPMDLAPGTYGVYIYADNNLRWNGSTNQNIGNDDVRINGGITMQDAFKTQLAGFTAWNGTIHYRLACISGTKIKVKATAKPLATGGDMEKGTLFHGVYNAGLVGQPDVVAAPDTIVYSIKPATGFPNSSYGSAWSIVSSTLTTLNGAAMPASNFKFTAPSGGNNATVAVMPNASYTDSFIKAKIVLRRNDNGCDTILERIIFVAPRPASNFNFTTVCVGDVTEFANTSTVASGTLSYLWNLGDGSGSNITDPARTYGLSKTYQVTLIATSNWGIKDSVTKTVLVKEIPKANFDFVNACAGTAVQFTDKSTLPGGTPTYIWNFGDGSPNGTGGTTAKLYAQPGIYKAALTVEVNGCFNTTSKYVTQAPRAVPMFSFTNSQCDNLNIPFTNASTAPSFGAVGYQWSFGDGDQSTSISPTHSYKAFKAYNVTLYTQTDLGCVDSSTQALILKESPKPVFVANGNKCTNQDITFVNSTNVPVGGANNYSWEFGDGKSSNDADPIHHYDAPGTYTVKLSAISAAGCSGDDMTTVTIDEKPLADYTATNVCQGSETEFTNGSLINNGTLTYAWNFGDNTSSTNTNPTVTYATAKTYTVSLVATSGSGCTDTATKSVEVYAIPPVNIDATSALWGNGTMKFTTNTTGVSYLWLFGDGGKSTDQNPNYQYQFAGTWNVTLIVVSPEGCTNTTTKSVLVNTTSVGDVANNNGVSVYPNPTAGTVTANFEQFTGGDVKSISVTDVLGRTVYTGIVAQNGLAQINLANQPAGVYNLNIETATGIQTVKVMVAR